MSFLGSGRAGASVSPASACPILARNLEDTRHAMARGSVDGPWMSVVPSMVSREMRRIRKALLEREPSVLPKIYDSSNKSMVAGYVAFSRYVDLIKTQLVQEGIARPACELPAGLSSTHWRSADVEMALWICPCIAGHHFTVRLIKRRDAGTLGVNDTSTHCVDAFRCSARRPEPSYVRRYWHRAWA